MLASFAVGLAILGMASRAAAALGSRVSAIALLWRRRRSVLSLASATVWTDGALQLAWVSFVSLAYAWKAGTFVSLASRPAPRFLQEAVILLGLALVCCELGAWFVDRGKDVSNLAAQAPGDWRLLRRTRTCQAVSLGLLLAPLVFLAAVLGDRLGRLSPAWAAPTDALSRWLTVGSVRGVLCTVVALSWLARAVSVSVRQPATILSLARHAIRGLYRSGIARS